MKKQPKFIAFNKTTRNYIPARVEVKNAGGTGAAELLIYNDIGRSYWDDTTIVAEKVRAALKQIPVGQQIKVRINSNGGSVAEGLAIYNAIAERRESTDCYNDGYACSIASVILLAGRTAICAKGSMVMIHEPWGMASGDAEDMRRYADLLDKHKDAILDIYEERTGLNREKLSEYMKAETWWTGSEAVSVGFATQIGEDEMEAAASADFDFSHFQRVPDEVKNRTKTKNHPASESDSGAKETMNRNQIIALLKAQGLEVDAASVLNATLVAFLNAANKLPEKDKTAALAWLETAEGKASEPKASGTPAPAPAPVIVLDAATVTRIQNLEAQAAAERKTRITNAVTNLVTERRITAEQQDDVLALCLADEKHLAVFAKGPQMLPGGEPVAAAVSITQESGENALKGIRSLREPITNLRKGNLDVQDRRNLVAINANARRIAAIVATNWPKLEGILNANTVASDLKLTVILNRVMLAFKRRLVALQAFSTNFGDIPLEGTDKIAVPYVPLQTTASTNFDAGDGYVYAEDLNTEARVITIDKRKYQSLGLTSSFLARQPMAQVEPNLMMKADQLALDVWLDIQSIITIANYGAAVIPPLDAASFDRSDVVDIQTAVVAAGREWPDMNRSLILGSEYYANLEKEGNLSKVNEAGNEDVLRRGAIGMLSGFSLYRSPRIPNNSEALVGYAAYPSAILVANSPIPPAPGVLYKLLQYEQVTDPDTGLTFEYRHDGDTQMDKDRHTIECNYGYAKGEGAAIARIEQPA